ncbi:proteophosphoglycan ppg4 [Strigomonas culicis]|uniref:Proteophosphoglycan ppg4 n=1 Tax=Strigomonas culicis TaxID=28005 RepID=S9UY53_9TRYP|nr:proteophosphoglycan ppg4 [Strigomonas culicis]|eukprot:EPY15475.1 proteophosphoglycan ppg4 [Strigomonas culicis]
MNHSLSQDSLESTPNNSGLHISSVRAATASHRHSTATSAGLSHGRAPKPYASSQTDLYNPDVRSSFHPQPIYLKVPSKKEQGVPEQPARRPWVEDNHIPSHGPPSGEQPTNKLAAEALALRRQLDETQGSDHAQDTEVVAAAVSSASHLLSGVNHADGTDPAGAREREAGGGVVPARVAPPGDEAAHALSVDTTIEQQMLHYDEDPADDDVGTALSAIPHDSAQLRTPVSAQADESATAPFTDSAVYSRLLYSMQSRGGVEGTTMLSARTDARLADGAEGEEDEERLLSLIADSDVGSLPVGDADAPQQQQQLLDRKAEAASREEGAVPAPAARSLFTSLFSARAADGATPLADAQAELRDTAAAEDDDREDRRSPTSQLRSYSASQPGLLVQTGTSRLFSRTELAEPQLGSLSGLPSVSAFTDLGVGLSVPPPPADTAVFSPPVASTALDPPRGLRDFLPMSSESESHGDIFEDIDSMYSRSRDPSAAPDQRSASDGSAEERAQTRSGSEEAGAGPAAPTLAAPAPAPSEEEAEGRGPGGSRRARAPARLPRGAAVRGGGVRGRWRAAGRRWPRRDGGGGRR